MFGAALVVVVAQVFAASTPAPDPSALVGQLGSVRFSERERAQAELTSLGRVAMPALRASMSNKDLEIRTRAMAILKRIEGSLLVEPSTIPLEFRDVRLSDALQSINSGAGLSLSAAPNADPTWADRRFTLDSGDPLPFWKAIDRICEASRAHYTLGGPTTPGQGASTFPIYEGYAPPPGPISDHGPFRVQLASVHYLNEVDLTGSRPVPGIRMLPPRTPRAFPTPASNPAASSRLFYLQLLVAAEPRLSIAPSGPVRVTEAFDEEGRSIVLPARQAGIQHSSGYFGMNASPVVRLRVDLAHPEGSGHRIKRVKGMIPVAVATRKSDPLVVPLDRPAGQAYRNDDVAITIREVRPARAGQPASVELAMRNVGAGPPAHGDGFEGDVLPYRPESPQQQLEVLDAQGRALSWFPKGSLYTGEETRLTMTILPGNGAGPPASIRHHGMIRGSTEIPFEFRDVPMP